MADAVVRTVALRWVSDDQPGVIEVSIVDADGVEHRIIEKVPVLTRNDLTSESPFPMELWIDADAGSIEGIATYIHLAHGVETTEGLTSLRVLAKNLEQL